jgi:hypothetical protein
VTRLRAASILAAVAFAAVLPFTLGYARHDFLFHVSSWIDMRAAWRAGILLPSWAPGASFNLGDPHLGLYPPLSLLLGGLLTLILPIQLAPAAFVWIALFACGLSMYGVSGFFVPAEDRLAAAMLNPYVIANALVRFAAGELLLQAFLPLVLLAVWRVLAGTPAGTPAALKIAILAALLALSFLSNFPGAVVLLYGITILAGILSMEQRSPWPILKMLLAEALALALAAFRLLPTWAERNWIHQAALYKSDPRMELLFMRLPPFPYNVLPNLFRVILCAEALIVFACLRHRDRPLRDDAPARAWAWLAAIAVLFQIPLAYPMWTVLPQLHIVQFPFRFLLLLAPVLPLLLLAPAARRSLRRPVALALGGLNLLPLLIFLVMLHAVRGSSVAEIAAGWQAHGYVSAPEYVPIGAPIPLSPRDLPPFELTARSGGACSAEVGRTSGLTRRFSTAATTAGCTMRLPVFFYPWWRATDESGHTLRTEADPAGLLVVQLPAGTHFVTVGFSPASPTRRLGTGISLAALVLLAGLCVIGCRSAAAAGRGSNAALA